MPPAEESKVTESLFGTTFARAAPLKGLDGDEVTFFVFSDLPVRTEDLWRPDNRPRVEWPSISFGEPGNDF
ncbi:hypothetical protein JB92DRAFT_3113494 [Gautieria morchelliformis]|nr:hypothetical protein JB92DRAFT_3113494 [Gautieria morchelliformis]